MSMRMPFEIDAVEEAFDPHRVPLAWRNLFADPYRLVRASAGIGFAVFLMLMQLGFKHAFLESAFRIIRALDGEVFLVSTTKYRFGETDNFPRARLYQTLADPDVISARPLYAERNVSIWKNPETKESFAIQVLAFDPDKPVIAVPEIAASLEALKQPDTILIDSRARKFLGTDYAARVGEAELARRRIRIVGTFPMGPDFTTDGSAIMGDRNFFKYFPERSGGDRLDRVEIGVLKIAPEADAEAVAARLGKRLANDVRVLSKEGLINLEADFQLEVSNVGPIFLLGTIIGFVVGMLISYQILFTDLSDQLPQFATLKAMGYKNSFLVLVVMQQAIFYGMVGFVPAVILALFAYGIVGQVALLPMELTLGIAAVSGALTFGMCVAAFRRRPPSAGGRPGGGFLTMAEIPPTDNQPKIDPFTGPKEPESTVSVKNVNHYFGEGESRNQALFDNNIEIAPGQLVIMTGPSGSGKTTLLTLAGALRSVQEGSVHLIGQNITGLDPEDLVEVRRNIGFIFQLHNLFDSLTAYENVKMAMQVGGCPTSEMRERGTAILDRLGLGERVDYKPRGLSGGQRQRVAIARALVNRPKINLADEPTAALDKKSSLNVVDLLKELADEEKSTILMVTHDNRILEAADRIVNMVDGRITSDVHIKESVQICELLWNSDVFKQLSPTEISNVAEKMSKQVHPPGVEIIKQGDEGDQFFLIGGGTVEVSVSKNGSIQRVTDLGAGDFFGEAALISGDPRNATVVSKDEVLLYVLGKDDFKAALDSSATFQEQLVSVYFQRQ